MYFRLSTNTAKYFLAIALCFAISFGAMASDIHPEAQVDSVCAETENVTSTTDIKVNDTILDNDRQQHSKHKHHVHNCGTCHINLICADSTPPHINCLKAISYTLKFDQSVIEKNPLGIFRPPRG